MASKKWSGGGEPRQHKTGKGRQWLWLGDEDAGIFTLACLGVC